MQDRRFVMYMLTLAMSTIPLTTAAAQTVQVQMFDGVSSSGAAGTAAELSPLVVDGLLRQLFDDGYIGIDAPAVQGGRSRFDAWHNDPALADVYIDFIIVVLAVFDEASMMPVCDFRLVRVADGSVMASGRQALTGTSTGTRGETMVAYAELGKKVARYCTARLKGSARRYHADRQA